MVKKFFLLIFVLMLVPSVAAVGISPPIKTLEYDPSGEYTVSFSASGASSIETYVRGNLAPYAEIIDSDPGGGPRTFTVKLRLPPDIEPPGKRTLLVGVIEGHRDGQISGRAAYNAPVIINIPYPGIYLEMDFRAPTVNLNEPVNFTVSLRNRGRDSISRMRTTIFISEEADKQIATLTADPVDFPGTHAMDFRLGWDTQGAKAGSYSAKAVVQYGDTVIERETSFRIGVQTISILNFTTDITSDKINPFDITIQSEWNSPFTSVYVDVIVGDDKFKTPSIDLQPWKGGLLRGYLDAAGLGPGEYPVTVVVNYGDTFTRATGVVNVIKQVSTVEQPIGFGFGGRVVLALFLAVVAMIIVYWRRHK